MSKCTAITRGGTRCRGGAIGGSDYCYSHDPDRAEERRRHASKGGTKAGRGRGRIPGEVPAIKARILTLAEDVLTGEQDKGAAAVAGQLFNTALRAVELERKIKETEDLERRLEALEERLVEKSGGTRRWQA